MSVVIIILGGLLCLGVINFLYERKKKKLKYEGTGILKKTKVSVVGERYVSGDEDSSGYYLSRLELKDETGNIYKSECFKDIEHGGRTEEEMKKKYNGIIYDLADKDNAIKQLNDNLYRLEMELQDNPGFFKKMGLKKDIKAMKKYIDIANEGPITPYLVLNGHKISVGDSIDVFVNPDKPSEYYVDLDFTKDK